ncbi:hypothetical protein ACFX2B_040374 [Malus domestica]
MAGIGRLVGFRPRRRHPQIGWIVLFSIAASCAFFVPHWKSSKVWIFSVRCLSVGLNLYCVHPQIMFGL